jgi:hypothetical protein
MISTDECTKLGTQDPHKLQLSNVKKRGNFVFNRCKAGITVP